MTTFVVLAGAPAGMPAASAQTAEFRIEETKAGEPEKRTHWWAPSLATSVKESFPDWTDRSKLKVYELVSVKAATP